MKSVLHGGFSRRALLAYCAAITAAIANDDNPLRTLRGGHPRLILLDAELDRLRLSIRESALIRKVYSELQREADRMLVAPVAEYKSTATQITGQSRRALDRIYTLALLYRIDHKQAYLDRALKELRAAAGFRDWNPSHFGDAAEMAHAFAIGYDWLYPALADEDRAWIRDAIIQKSLLPAMQVYRAQAAWTVSRFGFNAICNADLCMAALAIAEDDSELAGSIIRFALESVPRALATYGADGSWPEGPPYWANATRYFVYMAAALQTGLGLDFGLSNHPGLTRAGRFRIYFSGPTNKTFNFGESSDELNPEPAMFWLARRYAQPQFTWQEQKLAERTQDAEPLDLIWYQRDAKPPQGVMWPLDTVFASPPCAFFRSSWEDPNSLFLAVKGGDNKAPRAHFDLGSFVFDAGGVRWAIDPGPDDTGASPANLRPRGSSYKTRTEAHNTLVIDGENQDARGEARIVRHEFSPDLSWVQVDLSKAYSTHVKLCQRRIGLAQRQGVVIEDTIQTDQPADVQWGMVTDAEITVTGQTAELAKGAWTLSAEIRSPRHAVFDVVDTRGAPGTRKLVVRLGEKVTDLDLNISLIPHRSGSPRPKLTVWLPS